MKKLSGFVISSGRVCFPNLVFTMNRSATGWSVQVSVLNVADSVVIGEAIDTRARKIAYTRYHCPISLMLPSQFMEQHFDILWGQSRPSITVSIPITKDPKGQLKVGLEAATIEETEVSVHGHFSFLEADDLLRDTTGRDMYSVGLKECYDLAKALQTMRLESSQDISDDALRCAGCNSILQSIFGSSMLIVKEFVLLANTVVTQLFLEREQLGLFRNKKMADQDQILLEDSPEYLGETDILESLTTEWDEESLAPGCFYARPEDCYSVGGNPYLQISAPLRRYADLVNQRLLLAILRGQEVSFTPSELAELVEYLNGMERRSWRLRLYYQKKAAEEAKHAKVLQQIAADDGLRGYQYSFPTGYLSDTPSHAVEEVIRKKMRGNKLSFNISHFLLFETKGDGWAPLRQEVVSYLKRPNLAYLALQHSCAKLGCKLTFTRITLTKVSMYAVRANIAGPGIDIAIPEHAAKSEQKLRADICHDALMSLIQIVKTTLQCN